MPLTRAFHIRHTAEVTFRMRDDVEDVPEALHTRHPGSIWVTWKHQGSTWLVRMDVVQVDGRTECVGVELRSTQVDGFAWPPNLPRWDAHPNPVPRRVLRDLPLGQMLGNSIGDLATRTERLAKGLRGYDEQGDVMADELVAIARRTASRRRRGRPPYEQVAAIYREATRNRQSPTKAVAGNWRVSSSTAAKWVMAARKAPGIEMPPPTNVKRKRS